MNTIRLMTCENPIQANLVKGRLKNEGIPCYLTNEHFSALMPHYSGIMSLGIHVMVHENDYAKASEILELNVKKEVKCPACQSNEVRLGLGKNRIKIMLAILLSLIISNPINNINSIYICKKCGFEFRN